MNYGGGGGMNVGWGYELWEGGYELWEGGGGGV